MLITTSSCSELYGHNPQQYAVLILDYHSSSINFISTTVSTKCATSARSNEHAAAIPHNHHSCSTSTRRPSAQQHSTGTDSKQTSLCFHAGSIHTWHHNTVRYGQWHIHQNLPKNMPINRQQHCEQLHCHPNLPTGMAAPSIGRTEN